SSLLDLRSQHLHAGAGDRIAELVGDAAGDGRAARQREVRGEALTVGEVDGFNRLEGMALSELLRDEPALRGTDRPASRRQVAEFEAAVRVSGAETCRSGV